MQVGKVHFSFSMSNSKSEQDVNTNRTTPSPPSDDDAAEVENDDADDNDDDDDDNDENGIEPLLGRRRDKRHVGPHDDGGLQRTISTGISLIIRFSHSFNAVDLVQERLHRRSNWIRNQRSILFSLPTGFIRTHPPCSMRTNAPASKRGWPRRKNDWS